MNLTAGTRLGPYEIVGAIGAGGMGEVYKAHDSRLGRDVAIKILPEAFAADNDRRTRFEREAQAIAALSHPNILAIFDVGTYEAHAPATQASNRGERGPASIMCMVTELLDGDSLRARMDRGQLPLSKVLDYARQVASGLAAAHAKGITHRDIKPDNLFVTTDGRVKILDFGLTKQSDEPNQDATRLQSVTAAGVVLGTVGYMSPEQVQSETADARSDIFSFGVVLYELLAGTRPFVGGSAVQTMNAILTEDPADLASSGRVLPPALERVVRHCLEKNPEERFQSARDLAFALDALSSSSASSNATDGINAIETIETGRRRRSLLPYLTASAALAALVLAALAFFQPTVAGLGNHRFTPFSSESGGQMSAVWSPDGSAVAYSARASRFDVFQVFMRSLDRPAATQLTQGLGGIVVGWMPNGQRVVFRRGSALWSVATVGGLVEPFPFPEEHTDHRYDVLAPDGSALVTLGRYGDDGRNGIWISAPIGAPLVRYEPDPFSTDTVFNVPHLSFSPDGTKLLYALTTNGGLEMWLMPYPANAAEPPRRVVTDLVTYADVAASWMPDSRHVVLPIQPAPGAGSQLWRVDLDSGQRDAITSGTGDLQRGVVSPDGTQMIVSEVENSAFIVQVDLQTGTAKKLITNGRRSAMPVWAANVPVMAYLTERNGRPEIWGYSPGVPDRPLVTAANEPPGDTKYFISPAPSPDGNRLIYSHTLSDLGGGEIARLWISSTAGGAPVPLTDDSDAVELPGSWSPSGDQFVYLRLKDAVPSLMVVRTSGQASPEVLKSPVGTSNDSIPVWSPDGQWIKFRAADGADMLISPDDKREKFIRKGRGVGWVFSDDSKRLYTMRLNEAGDRILLFSIDVASGAERIVSEIDREYDATTWMSPSIRFSLAPDGKSFVYSSYHRNEVLWLFEGFTRPRGLLSRLGLR